jgi:hypothetical protein
MSRHLLLRLALFSCCASALLWLARDPNGALAAQPAGKEHPTPLYLTIVMHNEAANPRELNWLDEEIYLHTRGLLRRLALTIKSKSAMLNFQSDWTFLKAVAEFDKGQVIENTGGKNIIRWMVEDLGFEADPHAHETRYNYADVAYLHTQLGVKPSGNVGGFLFDPPDNPQGWEKHEKGINGRVYPDFFWKADNIWGAGTWLHRGNDERRHGVWKPQDRYHFYEHDPARRLVYIGGNCFSWIGIPNSGVEAIHRTVAAIASGQMPAEGYYTANLFLSLGGLNYELIERVAEDLDGLAPLVKQGKIIWSSLTHTANRWRSEYHGKPFQYPCLQGPK